jgi:hypothetical protein
MKIKKSIKRTRKNISAYREQYGHTLEELCTIFGCSTSVILKWHYQGALKQKLEDKGELKKELKEHREKKQ